MDLSLKQAADILTKSEDEVMFYVQTDKLQAGVNQESLAWSFKLDDVLTLKKSIEEESDSTKTLLME